MVRRTARLTVTAESLKSTGVASVGEEQVKVRSNGGETDVSLRRWSKGVVCCNVHRLRIQTLEQIIFKNSDPISQKTRCVSVTNVKGFLLFKSIIA
jgi:hypothetical protein